MRTNTRLLLSVAVSATALLAGAAHAQDAAVQEPPVQEDATVVDEIVVTGSRIPNRSRLETLAPVDVLPVETLNQQATTELAEALSTSAPSINFPRPSAVDGTDNVRPATLRGLSPDQTLVLVNGTRRHASSLVNVNGSVGRGSAAVDLNAIPLAALDRVEVLRDGASSIYGSDAIGGVINLRLREASQGGALSVTYGQYFTDVETARGSRSEEDGATVTVSGWKGFGLGDGGFLTISGEYEDREPTSRGDFDPRVTPTRVTSRYGDAAVEEGTVYLNAGLPLSNGWEAYGWAGYQHRDSESAAFFRIPANSNNVPAIYPDGFLPLIGVELDDYTAAVGFKGELAGWDADFTLAYGRNELGYSISNTLNPTYGAASQTEFDAGGFIYDQWVASADFNRTYEVGLAGPLSVATGIEARRESYEIKAGEPASYDRGPVVGPTPGAQGFPGLSPAIALKEDRSNVGAYVEIEAPVTERLTLNGAVRYEHYSDFGDSTTAKVAGRYEATENLAFRASASTGFRAPSLQQQFFTATSTNFIGGVPFETGTFPASSDVAAVLGGKPLEAEESVNLSAGVVISKGPFELTVDAYHIEIDDRIVLSENLGGRPDILALLAPYNVTVARFFINGVDTETDGIDVVGRYRLFTDNAGDFTVTGAINYTDTDIVGLPTNDVIGGLNPPPVLFGRVSQQIIENGTPNAKIIGAVDWKRGGWGATAKATWYDDAIEPNANPALDLSTGDKTLVDLEGRYRFDNGASVAVGVDNVFDVYPDQVPAALNSTGTLGFSRYSPFGFNGRYGYVRVGWSF